MSTDVYERLARHLDALPAGFPKTASGVEIRILQRLFSAEDAELALHLTLIPEEARVIARRARGTVENVSRHLDEMEKKGLALVMRRKNEPPLYLAQQFVVGFWEAQVDKLNRGLVEDFEEYLPTFFDRVSWRRAPQMRTIPVKQSINVEREVMPYERAEDLVSAHESFAVSNCICRQEHQILGTGCGKPLESCLTFGMAAETVVRNGRGRSISRDETMEILKRAEETGLVLQPANAKDPLFICTCCGCCCGVLRSIKRDPRPASLVSSPFFARLASDACSGCGTCVERCQMGALRLDEGKALLNLDRCIGCGLCVSRCPTDALSLVRKTEQRHVPKDIIDTTVNMVKARGRMRMARLVGLQIRSKLDRLLTPK